MSFSVILRGLSRTLPLPVFGSIQFHSSCVIPCRVARGVTGAVRHLAFIRNRFPSLTVMDSSIRALQGSAFIV